MNENGLTFYSPYSAFQQICRHYVPPRYDPTGTRIVEPELRQLVAKFGEHAGEFTFHNPLTDQEDTGAIIRGHYFNSKAAQERESWSDEERQIVEDVCMEMCSKVPEFIRLHEILPAMMPWPSYDETPAKQIADLAAAVGMSTAALAFERENKNRSSVIAAIEANLQAEADAAALEVDEASLSAA